MAEPCTCAFQRHLFPQCTQEKELRDLLRSNDPPSTFQASHCRSLSTASPAELVRYDDEILRLKAALLTAESERAAIQDYSRLCDAVTSPVRRLPSEILVEIFAHFTTAFLGPWLDRRRKCKVAEMKRLANVELLGISRVCPRWHQLIMGTSCLWNCVDLDLRVWDDEFDPQLLTLLRVVLDHGGNFPLDLGVVCGDGEATSRGLNVLATYSCRWRNVSISAYGPQKHLRLPAIEGNLPLLENLAIEVAGLDEAGVIPFFQVAPRLATVRVRALTSNISKLPLEQLKLLVFGDPEGPKELDDVTRIMTRLSGEVGIYLHLVGWEEQITAPRAEASPQVSNAFELFIRGRNASQVSTEAADLAMQDFLARLTLPRLRTLYVDSTGRQLYFPMPWSTDQFLALAHRSSFSTHLRTLILFPVFITEAELLQTLSSLDSLDDLTISDRKMINAEWGDLAVLTDSLLQHLTWTPGLGCVVPALRCFRCHTQLKFDDGLLRDFVLSRVRRELASAFEVELLWDQDHHRELDSGMLAQFEELSSRGELIFSAKPSALFQD